MHLVCAGSIHTSARQLALHLHGIMIVTDESPHSGNRLAVASESCNSAAYGAVMQQQWHELLMSTCDRDLSGT